MATFESLSSDELIARYKIGVEHFDPRTLHLSDAQLDMAWLASAGVGRWPVRVLLGHLADAELAFVLRMRQAVAEDRPTFAVWDENAFIDSGLYNGPRHPIGAFIAAVYTLRKWTGEWLGTLTDVQLACKALHPVRGEQTTRIVLNYATWHLEHHAWYLNAKVARMLRPGFTPEPLGPTLSSATHHSQMRDGPQSDG